MFEIDVTSTTTKPAITIKGLTKGSLRRMQKQIDGGGLVTIPITPLQLRVLGQRAASLAARLMGIPEPVEQGAAEHPSARYWPAVHPALEIGVPDELVFDASLSTRRRFLWFILWRECTMAPRAPTVDIMVRTLAVWLQSNWMTVRDDILALQAAGWARVRPTPGARSMRGLWRVELYLRRQPVPDGAGAEAPTVGKCVLDETLLVASRCETGPLRRRKKELKAAGHSV